MLLFIIHTGYGYRFPKRGNAQKYAEKSYIYAILNPYMSTNNLISIY